MSRIPISDQVVIIIIIVTRGGFADVHEHTEKIEH